MAKPTERALKRKPKAVILLTTKRADVPAVPPEGREFEWFNGDDKGQSAADDYFAQNVGFHTEDVKEHDDMAYMAVVIADTSTEPMSIGQVDVQPNDNDKVIAWMEEVKSDITKAFTPVTATTSTDANGAKKSVRPRKKSAAAAVVKKTVSPPSKADTLKARLAAKKAEAKPEAKPETGDAPPKKAAAKRPATKRAAPRKPVVKETTEASASEVRANDMTEHEDING